MQRFPAVGKGKQSAAQSGKGQNHYTQYGKPDQIENETEADSAECVQHDRECGELSGKRDDEHLCACAQAVRMKGRRGQNYARHGKHGQAH